MVVFEDRGYATAKTIQARGMVHFTGCITPALNGNTIPAQQSSYIQGNADGSNSNASKDVHN
jgi:hypothetical protein